MSRSVLNRAICLRGGRVMADKTTVGTCVLSRTLRTRSSIFRKTNMALVLVVCSDICDNVYVRGIALYIQPELENHMQQTNQNIHHKLTLHYSFIIDKTHVLCEIIHLN